ncbi:MAG: hypothetical protein IJA69_02855 [Clostridia bacterium]|nr:hypothetical protein [Clostridia bacterium]
MEKTNNELNNINKTFELLKKQFPKHAQIIDIIAVSLIDKKYKLYIEVFGSPTNGFHNNFVEQIPFEERCEIIKTIAPLSLDGEKLIDRINLFDTSDIFAEKDFKVSAEQNAQAIYEVVEVLSNNSCSKEVFDEEYTYQIFKHISKHLSSEQKYKFVDMVIDKNERFEIRYYLKELLEARNIEIFCKNVDQYIANCEKLPTLNSLPIFVDEMDLVVTYLQSCAGQYIERDILDDDRGFVVSAYYLNEIKRQAWLKALEIKGFREKVFNDSRQLEAFCNIIKKFDSQEKLEFARKIISYPEYAQLEYSRELFSLMIHSVEDELKKSPNLNEFIDEYADVIWELGKNTSIANICGIVQSHNISTYSDSSFWRGEREKIKKLYGNKILTNQQKAQIIKDFVIDYQTYGKINPMSWQDFYEIAKKSINNLTFEQFREKVSKNPKLKDYMEQSSKAYANTIEWDTEGYPEDAKTTYQKHLYEFEIIFAKTRFEKFLSCKEMDALSLKQKQNFNLKVYEKLRQFNGFSESELASENRISEVEVFFGLFEKDKDAQKRLDKLCEFMNLGETYFCGNGLLEYVCKEFNKQTNSNLTPIELKNSFFTEAQEKYYVIKEGVQIPAELKGVFKSELYFEKEFKDIKLQTGAIGKKIGDFLSPYKKTEKGYELKRGVVVPEDLAKVMKQTLTEQEYNQLLESARSAAFLQPYEQYNQPAYLLKKGLDKQTEKALRLAIWTINSNHAYENGEKTILTHSAMHSMFASIRQEGQFDQEFYDFIIKNWHYAIKPINQSKLLDVKKSYKRAQTYYAARGKANLNYEDVLDLLRNIPFIYEYGNEEFATEVKNAGVNIQESYEFYEKLLPKLEERKLSTIPRHEKTYTFTQDGKQYKVCTKILRLDDPTTMLVGESKFSNCCQKYFDAGQACMEHASTSQDGGILATYLIDENQNMQMLTQSWVWTNEQVLCLDNVEATSVITLKNGKEKRLYQDIATYAIKMAAEDILKTSEAAVSEYAERQKQIAQKTLTGHELEKRLVQIEKFKMRQTLAFVTVGSGYDDLNVSQTFAEQGKDIAPKDYYGYRDSQQQFVVAKTSAEQLYPLPDYQQTPIYRDERRVFEKQGEQITQKILKHITEIEKAAHKNGMYMYTKNDSPVLYTANNLADICECYIKDLKVIVGEDWYFVYSDNGYEIEIFDMAKTQPRLADEKSAQQKEMMDAFKKILESAIVRQNGQTTVKTINADLREDTSYLLYLFQLKHGLIEQVGEDLKYDFDNDTQKTAISATEQLEILKNAKQVRERADQKKTTMHKISFKPSQKFIDRVIDKQDDLQK